MKAFIKTLLGHRPAPGDQVGIEALERNWIFHASRPDGLTAAVRLIERTKLAPAPAYRPIMPIVPRPRWVVYFVYLPTGKLTAAHRFTLERLRRAEAGLCIVCAAPTVSDVPDALRDIADALYWKALPGFDFSAYALAIEEVARHSAGADVLILNDSVFGPFVAADTLWPKMHWDLTGFTASAQLQNHIQSYAFHMKQVNKAKVHALRGVLSTRRAFDHYRGAVYRQESRFASVAARTMSVGALWYADGIRCGDPSILAALPLLEADFPFLKRSLLGKNDHIWERGAILDALRVRGHPTDDL